MTRLAGEVMAMVGVFVLIPFGLAEAVHHAGINPFMAIAADAAPGLSCSAPSQTSCLGPTGFDPTIAGER